MSQLIHPGRMLHGLRGRVSYANVTATLALFFALAGGSAYAINEWNSSNIQNETLLSEDIKNGQIGSADVKDNSINTFDANALHGSDIIDSSLTGADIQNFSLGANDIADNNVDGIHVLNDSLTGNDINESSLSMPPTTTATFAGQGNVTIDNQFRKVVGRTLPAGSYAIAATANVVSGQFFADVVRDTFCELRNPSGAFIGGGRDRRFIPDGQSVTISLSMNGGVQIPAGGGEVGLYCRFQDAPGQIADGQMMIIRLDGFF